MKNLILAPQLTQLPNLQPVGVKYEMEFPEDANVKPPGNTYSFGRLF